MPPTFDHRARPVRLHMRLARSRAGRERLTDVPYPVLNRIETRRRDLYVPPRSLVTLANFLGAWVALAIISAVTMNAPTLGLILALLAFAAAIVVVVVRVRIMRRRDDAAIIAAYLSERRCPACGYELTELEAADDGCTVCPECAAAWNGRNEP